VRGLIRNPDHQGDVQDDGATAVLCDLEQASVEAVAEALAGADAVVFSAGAGPGSGAQRKLTVDRDAAILLLAAARSANVARYLIVSSVGAESPPAGDDDFSVYLRAKADADAAVAASDRDWTILRPGPLTNDPGSEQVSLTREATRGPIPRDDVAAVLAGLLGEPRSAGLTLYLKSGETPVGAAIAALV